MNKTQPAVSQSVLGVFLLVFLLCMANKGCQLEPISPEPAYNCYSFDNGTTKLMTPLKYNSKKC